LTANQSSLLSRSDQEIAKRLNAQGANTQLT